MRRRTRVRVFGAAVVVGVLLTGCNGEPGPEETSSETVTTSTSTETSTETVTASPSESVTPQPSETSVLPPLPDAAKENTAEGAEAFIRYYFEVLNLSVTQPANGLIPQLAYAECESCAVAEERAESFVAEGKRATGDPYVIKSMARVGGTPEDMEYFNMEVRTPAVAVENTDGTVGTPSVAGVLAGEGAAIWEDGRWQLFGLALQRS